MVEKVAEWNKKRTGNPELHPSFQTFLYCLKIVVAAPKR